MIRCLLRRVLYAGPHLVRIPRTAPMPKREDDHLCAVDAVHHAIGRMHDLPILGSTDFGHESTATGKPIDLANPIDEFFEPCGGRAWAMLGDIVDGFTRSLLR